MMHLDIQNYSVRILLESLFHNFYSRNSFRPLRQDFSSHEMMHLDIQNYSVRILLELLFHNFYNRNLFRQLRQVFSNREMV